jgi:hypothetical protein
VVEPPPKNAWGWLDHPQLLFGGGLAIPHYFGGGDRVGSGSTRVDNFWHDP